MSRVNFDQLIKEFKPIVNTIVYKIMNKMNSSLCRDDLIQVGLIGLCNAAKRSNIDTRTNQFKCYVSTKIYGSVIDEIRQNDFLSRSVRDSIKNGTADDYTKSLADLGDFLDITNFDVPDSKNPLDILVDEEERILINNAANQCEPRDKLILDMLYNEGITKREAAERLGLHESRINQLHKRAINKIKDELCA